jgi:hypothetical protein
MEGRDCGLNEGNILHLPGAVEVTDLFLEWLARFMHLDKQKFVH